MDEFEVWDQPLVTAASGYDIPWTDYAAWAEANSPELVFFDQNYGFEEIARLRSSGVRTIGRFVWEPVLAPARQGRNRGLRLHLFHDGL